MEERVKKKRAKTVFTLILLVLANVIVFGYIWLVDKYDKVQLDQILYQLKSSTKGTNPGFVLQSFLLIFSEVVIATLIEIGIYLILSGKAKKLLEKSAFYIKYSASKVCAFFKKRALSLTAIQLIFAMIIFIVGLDVGAFVITSTTESDFIEENYVDPESVDIKFPEQKRNLIYIFLESMETTFSDTEAGGSITEDFIPELSELAAENVSFSNTDGMGGASSTLYGKTKQIIDFGSFGKRSFARHSRSLSATVSNPHTPKGRSVTCRIIFSVFCIPTLLFCSTWNTLLQFM